MKKVNVAVIGFGHLGRWHTQKAYNNENSNLVAIVESFAPNQKKAKEIAEFKKAEKERKKREKAAAEQAAREANTAKRAMAANPEVYRNAGITSGGFASQNTGTNENFSNKSGRGRTGYNKGGLATMFKLKG